LIRPAGYQTPQQWLSRTLTFNDKLSDLRRALYREATSVMQKAVLKGTRWLLLKNPENLDTEKDEKQRLKEALTLNKPLATAYYLKDDLRRFWNQPGRAFATTYLDGWIRRANASGIKVLQQMAKTLAAHRTGLLVIGDN
jgi:transposase